MHSETQKKMNTFKFKCYRKILGVPYLEQRTNESITKEIADRKETLLSTFKQKKLKWFGRVTSHQDDLQNNGKHDHAWKSTKQKGKGKT